MFGTKQRRFVFRIVYKLHENIFRKENKFISNIHNLSANRSSNLDPGGLQIPFVITFCMERDKYMQISKQFDLKAFHYTQVNVRKMDANRNVIISVSCLWHNAVIYVITKTRLYNFDLLKPHFYIVKLGFTGVYIIFLISAQNMVCGYLLEPPRRGGSNENS